MIVDASALLAVILSEPDRESFLKTLNSARQLSMSLINFVETGIKVDKDPDTERAKKLDVLVQELDIAIVAVTAEHGRVAREAHKVFGRGSGHPARLNFGDCFAYALAKTRREPLLFKGDDFAHTDLEVAV